MSNATDGLRWANVARALKSRNYRLFFFGQGVSLIGTWMQRTALLWLVGTHYSDVRDAAFWLGVVGFSSQIPAIVLTPLAGVLADRWDRHRMIIGTQVLTMLQALVLAALTLNGVIEIWHIIVLSLWLGGGLIVFSSSRSFTLSLMLMSLLGMGQMLVMASTNTVLQTIVDDDKRGRVMSFHSLAFMGMVPIGNLLAGALAGHIGPSPTIAIGGGLFLVTAVVFSRSLPGLRKLVHPIYVRKGISIE